MDRIKDIINEYRNYLIYGILIIIILILALIFWFSNPKSDSHHYDNNNTMFTNNTSQNVKDINKTSSSSFSNSFSNSNNNNEAVVDVKGAVKNPGVYQLSSTLRIDDAVEAAGGFIKRSDRNHINLAQKLKDQQIIYVPFLGEVKSKLVNDNNDSSSVESSNNNISKNDSNKNGSKVNINTSDENELQKIDGVGDKKATKIIDYRKEHGNFNKIEDIKNISGFGDRSFENIKNFISVQ